MVERHASTKACFESIGTSETFAFSTKGNQAFSNATFREGCTLLFGPETRGLPVAVLEQFDNSHVLRIPMTPTSRSLNLSNAVSIAVYEVWRQLSYGGQA